MSRPDIAPEVNSSTSDRGQSAKGSNAIDEVYSPPPLEIESSPDMKSAGDGLDSTKSAGLENSNESSLFNDAYSGLDMNSKGLEKPLSMDSAGSDHALTAFDMNGFQIVDSGKPVGDSNNSTPKLDGASNRPQNDPLGRDTGIDTGKHTEKPGEGIEIGSALSGLSLGQGLDGAESAEGSKTEKAEGKKSEDKKENLSEERIKELIKGLDSDSFREREAATKALSEAGNLEDVMKHLAETVENPASLEQKVRAQNVAFNLGKNASPEQLQSMYNTMNEGDITGSQKQLYESAVNGGLYKAEKPVTFTDSQGRISGIYDGHLKNPLLTAKYNEAGQVEEATTRGVKFSRNEDGSYTRSDGFTAENATVSEYGVRFYSENGNSTEWRPNGDTAFYDKGGSMTALIDRQGRDITPRRMRDFNGLPRLEDNFPRQ